ncbi:MAG: hypothetical protein AAFX09_07240 [Pseudomonadota bacterium]
MGADFAQPFRIQLRQMVNKRAKNWFSVCNLETMKHERAPFLNRVAACGLAVSSCVLTYAGFLELFEDDMIAAFAGAVVGGYVLGAAQRLQRTRIDQRG